MNQSGIAVSNFIDEQAIYQSLLRTDAPEAPRVRAIFSKARALEGLSLEEVAELIALSDPELLEEMFATSRAVKEEIYGSRLVLFAPLYISNRCVNECVYCAFRAANREVKRRTLSQAEIAAEIHVLVEQGHKRVLMVAGESLPGTKTMDYLLESIATIYATRTKRGEVRRVNVNVAPLQVEQYRQLKDAGIGTYQIFQETYHRKTYAQMHKKGPKTDFDWRVTAMDRAMEAGIDDVGIGPLFGLYNWRFEVLAMLQHIRHLEERFGCGPHTISMPRLEPAVGSAFASHPPHAVSDADFLKLIAILRMAVPYTGMIMSTRETAAIRRQSFHIGISQTSAGSRTDPGGYGETKDGFQSGQFAVGDQRPLAEVVREIAEMGFTPSFCTACYRLGRTGKDFMDMAKPGAIKYHCEPNALSTFVEYLEDFAPPATVARGCSHLVRQIAAMDKAQKTIAEPMIARVRAGERDVFV
jgi:2-iminoacetate synthase